MLILFGLFLFVIGGYVYMSWSYSNTLEQIDFESKYDRDRTLEVVKRLNSDARIKKVQVRSGKILKIK